MATTYEAVRGNGAPDRQIFSGGTDALVVSVPDTGAWDVVAVAKDLTTAQLIVDALNGV